MVAAHAPRGFTQGRVRPPQPVHGPRGVVGMCWGTAPAFQIVCHHSPQFLRIVAGLPHQLDERVAVLCPVCRHHPADAVVAVPLQDPAHLHQDGAMVVEKRLEALAAGMEPPLDHVDVECADSVFR